MTYQKNLKFLGRVLPAVGLSLALASPAMAASAGTEFYKGKTVTYIVATSAGGSYDTYGRLVAETMQKYLPGSTFIVKNMPGAGHIIGANAIYGAKPDGLTIGSFNTGLIYTQMVGRQGVKFDLAKMSWIGKAASEPRVIMVSANSPINSFEALQKSKERVNFASSGIGSASFVESTMLIDSLKLPIKLIPNFSGQEGEMAMRRGEVAGILGSRSSLEPFVKNGYGKFIAQIGGKDKDVPQLSGLIREPKGKALVSLIESNGDIARLTAGPAGIPKDRLEALRTAYKRAMEDKDLQARVAKLGLPLEPAYGEEVQKKVKAALDQSPETVALLGKTLDIKDPMLKAEGPLIAVEDKGREISFAGHDGQKVSSKPSGSRTRITIAGKDAKREDLKAGMDCEISYKSGGDNEPTAIECK